MENLAILPERTEKPVLSVLLVEDDEIYSQLVCRYLNQISEVEYVVTKAKTATEGLKLCIKYNFDAVLIDHGLPDLTGIQLTREIKDRLELAAPPCIIMTSGDDEMVASKAIHVDAADYLPKGVVSKNVIVRSIGNAIAKHRLALQIARHTNELEVANTDLRAKNIEIGNFYQKISHEVKTPLAAAREFVAIVRDGIVGETNDNQNELLEHALASCDQIANHFNDLVEITRLDAKKNALKYQNHCVSKLVTRSVVACLSASSQDETRVKQIIPDSGLEIRCDGNRVIQVLSNLLSNALKYSDANDPITIQIIADTNGCTEFVVSDTGCGIDFDQQEKIFDRLYQVDEKENIQCSSGLGLGLSIAKEIVELHKGVLWVNSEPGVGSKFHFTIPETI